MATRRQKGKHRKRAKAWHRGAGEARRWSALALPDVASGADPTTAQPVPHRNGRPRKDTP